jgi:hypothetical protein
MDQLLKQFGGAGAMASLFSGAIPGNSQEEDEEILDEEALMENARVSYDIYI